MQTMNNNVFTGSIVTQLDKINEDIYKLDVELTEKKEELAKHKLDVATLEAQYKVEVAFDTTLTNERQREAALLSRKRESFEWMEKQTSLIPKLDKDINVCEANRSFKARHYQILISYLKASSNAGDN